MRLIDADALVSVIRKASSEEPGNEYIAEMLVEMMNEMPTAFDKEKVIAQLKDNANTSSSLWEKLGEEVISNKQVYGESMAYKRAIAIVEKGGI